MEMCYDGALVMPCSYAVMSEDEMTYVEGGASYVRDASVVAEGYYKASRNAKVLAVLGFVCATVAGAYIGGFIGGLIGGVAGFIVGSVFWGWSSACSAAAVEASQYTGKVRVTETLVNLDLVIKIRKA